MSLSVIVPVYNVEKYICKCINSLLTQTVKPDEIILVDDGSNDKSGAICDEYALKNNIITVIHKTNAGLGMARNTGLEYVTSEFVTFFDSDDFADSDYIEQLMKPINEGFDTCKSSYKRVDIDGKYLLNETIEPGQYMGQDVKNKLIPRLIGSSPNKKDSIPMSSCSTIYSMDIIKKYNLSFVSEREWISEDILFNIEYYLYAQKVKVIQYIGYNYRVNSNSLTTKYISNRFEQCKAMYAKEVDLLNEHEIYDITKERLNRQFFNYLRMCFAQTRRSISGLSFSHAIANIKKICKDELVKSIIANYPMEMLGVKQRGFLYAVKSEAAFLLFLFYNVLHLD